MLLVVPLRMKVLDEFAQRTSQRCFAEHDQFRQALLLNRAYPSFRAGVWIPRRQLNRLDSAGCKLPMGCGQSARYKAAL